jgi:hypothetical protein
MYPWASGIDGLDPSTIPIPSYTESVGASPEEESSAAGQLGQDPTGDLTPYKTHAAPYPKGLVLNRLHGPDQLPEGNAAYLNQSASIHESDTGAGRAFLYDPTYNPKQDTWTDFYDVEPGQTILDPDIGSQGKSGMAPGGWGSHSREQSNAVQNTHGFDSAHMHRRYATGSVPGNYMWMRPGGRPMVKSMPGPARPAVGQTSPFAGQDVGFGYYASSPVGGVLQDLPAQYEQPATPQLGTPIPDTGQNAPEIDLW